MDNASVHRQPRRKAPDCIALRITHDLHRRYKQAALDADLNLTELFKATFEFWEEHHGAAER
jgi:hypothetical protein